MIYIFQKHYVPRFILLQVIIALYTLGCGFQPLHNETGGTDAKWLASIQVAKIPTRSGQKLRSLLLERVSPKFLKINPKYDLLVRLTESKVNLAIRKDETATRANLTITADYKLRRRTSKKTVISGRISSTNSYNILTSEFATMSAENNARDRVIRSLAHQIPLRISAKFHKILGVQNSHLPPQK